MDDSSIGSTSSPKDSNLLEEPSKKRPRPNTPDDAWTSRLDNGVDDNMSNASMPATVISNEQKHRYTVLVINEDPGATTLQDASTEPLPLELFRQPECTEAFESLLQLWGYG
ncbi:hypothetical protein DEU56DRAFT_806470 [Suillus clintonianus]|uniref:uncharacterized protein n=1 Tax=Suillus clintonianus TaxID=1904413 RepID=UPI001B874C0B|nr:uncharacterized protein DEU56DRAFT_806470 [Suillus clintonianus]KAG2135786.1 hypothetical protein DEU56DRAFT_806470 [Suillus clintonianus]